VRSNGAQAACGIRKNVGFFGVDAKSG